MNKDFSECNVIVYDNEKKVLVNVEILEHIADENMIVVENVKELVEGTLCSLLILATPTPYAYDGRIRTYNRRKIIALFNGEAKESRKDIRYMVDLPVHIVSLIHDGKPYPMHKEVSANLVNISRGGIRIRTAFNALSYDDRFQMRLNPEYTGKMLAAEVIHRFDEPPEYSEYNCRLLID